jgi:WD40 repeat protein
MIVYHPNASLINAYNIHTGDLIESLQGHYDRVNCCTFHPIREELYSGGKDHKVLAWTPLFDELDTQEELVNFLRWDIESKLFRWKKKQTIGVMMKVRKEVDPHLVLL